MELMESRLNYKLVDLDKPTLTMTALHSPIRIRCKVVLGRAATRSHSKLSELSSTITTWIPICDVKIIISLYSLTSIVYKGFMAISIPN